MPSTKDDAKIYGSGDPEYQEEARQDAIERAGDEDIYNANPDLYWTAQQGSMPTVPGQGPQVYLPEQLPDPEVARAGGITPQFIPETIVAGEDLEVNDPKGPEPSDRRNIEEGAFYDWTENAKIEAAKSNPLTTVQGSPVYEEGEEGEEVEAGSMNKAELVDRARELGIQGYSSMNKAELEEAVAEYDG